ncbi:MULTISPECIES: M56 family metallopeptidase [Micromonospora]|uniref:Zn-dependent protease with chaperone function n=1 Tax=Micromonospora yangpuensis TaxID=683228 RepID=A0A1C6UWR1_9ACTN|nr:M56 family metallopeptidase [Micromonospora yangpuensis]GGM25075.1 membrane protein [Micromonospora yangpuensis]SCL58495.1 Zn-dependent protease with chaperone function [Micromonospora yangpuensis]
MFAAAVCLLVAVTSAAAAPVVLRTGTWQVRSPKTALTVWLTMLLVGAGSAAFALADLVRITASPHPVLGTGLAAHLVAWTALALLATTALLVGVHATTLAARHQDEVADNAPDVIRREKRGKITIVEFRSDTLTAYAAPGRDPRILYSCALEAVLTADQMQAVLAHEYAHLRYRHDWLVRIADLNALLLPRSWAAGMSMRRAVGLLVELVADDTAAKQAGAAHLADALVRIGEPGMQLRAERLGLRPWPPSRPHRLPAAIRLPG